MSWLYVYYKPQRSNVVIDQLVTSTNYAATYYSACNCVSQYDTSIISHRNIIHVLNGLDINYFGIALLEAHHVTMSYKQTLALLQGQYNMTWSCI